MSLGNGASSELCTVFAIDTDHETELGTAAGMSRLEVIKNTVLTFASLKLKVNPGHHFALAILREGAQLVMGPTPSLSDLAHGLKTRVTSSHTSFHSFDIASLPQVLTQVEGLLPQGEPPSLERQLALRMVVVYCRSCVVPSWPGYTRPAKVPQGAIDVLYIHEKPVPGVNCPQEVFSALEEEVDLMSSQAGHHAYIYETSAANAKKWSAYMTSMLAPAGTMLRPPQQNIRASPWDILA